MKLLISVLFILFLIDSHSQYEYEVFVSDRDNSAVKRYDINGNFIDNFITSGSGGLSYTEDILFHPDGSILVTGVGNSTIKKYDGTTGAYLGNFSSGFTLTDPSKMSLGPDSLIYVTQWAGTLNVVRFNLDGSFVDEFTSVSVANGLDHFWDADTNFYIAEYTNGANGFVHKFDKNGNDLGVFIPTTNLQGPTSMWVDQTGDILVEDWTTGQVHRFDSNGNYESVFISGMTNPEGVAFLPNGDFLICDWGEDAVHRFAADGSALGYFTSGNGLTDPNSVVVRHNPGVGIVESATQQSLTASYDEVNKTYLIKWNSSISAQGTLKLIDAAGKEAALIYSGNFASGDNEIRWTPSLSVGIYFIQLSGEAGSKTIKLVIQ